MAITIVTAAQSTDLTTLITVKEELQKTDTTDDGLLSRLIAVASGMVVNFCGRNFAQERIQETIFLAAGKNILLSRFPVDTLHTVKFQTILVPATEYFLENPNAGLLTNFVNWKDTAGKLDYEVEYTHGFVLPSFTTGTKNLPPAVEEATIDIVRALFFARQTDPSVLKEEIPQVFKSEKRASSGIGGKTGVTPLASALLEPFIIRRALR